MTLRFLGDVPDADVPSVAAALTAAAGEALLGLEAAGAPGEPSAGECGATGAGAGGAARIGAVGRSVLEARLGPETATFGKSVLHLPVSGLDLLRKRLLAGVDAPPS